MRRVLKAVIAGLILILVVGWAMLSAPFLGNWRAGLVQGWLDDAGGGVTISGPVSIGLGSTVHVTADDIGFDAPVGDFSLARAEADLSLSDLLHRKINPTNIVISGAAVTLVRDATGAFVGRATDGQAQPAAVSPPDADAMLAALAGKTVRLVDARVRLEDQVSRFSFTAEMTALQLQGDAGEGATTLQGAGTLNGQPLDLSVSVSKNAPFSAKVTSAATQLTFAGAEGSTGISGGLLGQISVESTDLSQTLQILQLAPVLNGTASARATLTRGESGDLALDGIDASALLEGGQSARISGSIGNLAKLDDADIAIDARVYPLANEPPPAHLLKDLRLTSVHLTLAGPLKGDTRRSMAILTNGFSLYTAGVGPAPVKLSKLSRGANGELVVGSIEVQIGPVEAPWLRMNGQAGDLLQLSGLAMGGEVAFPMSTILGPENQPDPASLGTLAGQFKITGSAEALALSDISLATQDTDLWTLSISGGIARVLPLSGVSLKMDASIRTAALLKALGKEPIELSPLDLHLTALSTDDTGTIAGTLVMQMASSNLAVKLSTNNRGQGPVIKGTITSDLIRLDDLRDGLLAIAEISSEIHRKPPAAPSSKRPVTRSQSQAAKDDVEGITIGVIDKEHLLRYGDVDINLRIDKIAGKVTVKGIDAQLVVGGGKASFGPMKFSYGEGSFDLHATIDALTSPKIVRLKGSTGGWDFGDIVKAMRVKFPASGTLNAEFDLSGEHSSVSDFINTMSGSTTVRMRNGSIATSLLDLAGLGVVPWLFSKDRKAKFATITCLRAPLVFSNGVVSSKQAVVETPEVQLVAYGSVNLPRRTISVGGQPRPVGKPLTRSPWPFTLSGSLNDPKVKVKDGPSKVRRVDGANKMPAKRVPCVPDILQLK